MRAIASPFTLASLVAVGLTVFCAADDETVATDPRSGLRIDADNNWRLIKAHCSACHSERLLTQQQLDRKSWIKAIKRMQTEENLYDLGDSESKILDYLSTYYGASGKPKNQRVRRAPLKQIPIVPPSTPQSQSANDEDETSSNDAESKSTSNELESSDQNLELED